MANLSNINDKFLVTTGGNVLIGATADTGFRLHVTGGPTRVDSYLSLGNNGYIRADTANMLRFQSGTADITFYNSSNSVEHVRIKNNTGNVGIGTDSPNTALQVNQSTTVPLLVHRQSNTNFDPHGIGFSTRSDAINGGLGDVRSGIFSDYNGDLFLAAATSSITTSPLTYSRLFIEGGNGNVGIGTISPDYTLDVEKDVDTWIARIYNTGNDANAQGLLIRSDANSSHDALVMGVYADGGYKMILRSTGLLGIGVSPFINNLTNGVGIDLKNNAGLIGYANAMYISSNAYYNSGWKYKAAGTANLLQVGSTTGTVSLRQAISGSINQAISFDQTITILNNGNVGIGYTNPASNKLEVNGRAYIGPIGTGFGTTKPTMQSNAVLRLKPHDTNSTNMNFASVNGGGGIGIQTTNGPGTANWDIALSPFGGDVGIGMVQPAAKLDVVGNIATGTRDGGVGYKNQLFQCSKTATGSGVGIDVMFVGHTHALNITVMCIIDGAQAAVGRGYALSTYGYATATLTQTKVNGNMVGVSMIYVNSGGSESYILRVTPTYAGSSNPTIYLSAQGQSNILLRTAV